MKTGIELIAEERQEQIEKHGRSIERDVKENDNYQLSNAAGLLALIDNNDVRLLCPKGWNELHWKRMCDKSYEQRLIIAGALIAAEIDRIQRI